MNIAALADARHPDRSIVRRTTSWRRHLLVSVFACLLLPTPSAWAQSLDAAVANALNNSCRELGANASGIGPFGPQLAAICIADLGGGGGGVPTSGAQSGAGGSATFQTRASSSDEERRLLQRLKERRDTKDGANGRGASAETRTFRGLGLFVSGEYESFDKDVTRFEPGSDSDRWGATLGADYMFGREWVAGIAFNYAHVRGSFDQSGGDFETDSYGGFVYGSALPIPNLFIDVVAGYARKHYDTSRAASFSFIRALTPTTVGGTVSSTTDGDEYKAGVSAGYDFVIDRFTVGPRVGLLYKHTTVDAFSERGNTGLELAYFRQHETSFTSSLGVYASMAVSTPIGVLVPQTTLEYVHEFADDQRAFYFRFVQDGNGTKLRFQNDPPDRDYFNVSVGLVMVLPHAISPFINYRTMLGYTAQSSHTVTAGLRFNF